MNRDDLIRELRKLARKAGIHFAVIPGRGKGSHYRVEFGERWTTVQSGEFTPEMVRRIKKQLGIV
jgi:predicted DNA-binding protein with PD1-like motif